MCSLPSARQTSRTASARARRGHAGIPTMGARCVCVGGGVAGTHLVGATRVAAPPVPDGPGINTRVAGPVHLVLEGRGLEPGKSGIGELERPTIAANTRTKPQRGKLGTGDQPIDSESGGGGRAGVGWGEWGFFFEGHGSAHRRDQSQTARASGAPVTPYARTLATQAVDPPFLRPYRRGCYALRP